MPENEINYHIYYNNSDDILCLFLISNRGITCFHLINNCILAEICNLFIKI